MNSSRKAPAPPHEAREVRIEELLGRLNEVEEKNKPDALFTIGDTSLLQGTPRAAIVGARNASELGLARARKLARLLAGRDVVVVSGLAEGVDTAAHWAAIRAGGRTIGVLGSPLDVLFRQADADLRERMEKEHLVVSQFPSGHPVLRSNFPRRNRTMALLTHATVIIEASDTSGSLSQGWEALRLGRQLFILKSVADDPRLTWPAEMVKYGAAVLSESGVETLFDALPPPEEPGWLDRLAF
ncbi:MAG: DNA-processing protein DprA [Holophagales bacterium]|nr:DNA-processing protein DprA [Holophagales bacterium]MBK9963543.1 DNA-processing protein DprA [Holophagales bacterium]